MITIDKSTMKKIIKKGTPFVDGCFNTMATTSSGSSEVKICLDNKGNGIVDETNPKLLKIINEWLKTL